MDYSLNPQTCYICCCCTTADQYRKRRDKQTGRRTDKQETNAKRLLLWT